MLDPIPQNDMSMACGMTSNTEDRFYQGWFKESHADAWLPWYNEETSFQKFSRVEWESLGAGNNLDEAVLDAIYEQTVFDPNSAIHNYRIKGQTFLWEVRLSSN